MTTIMQYTTLKDLMTAARAMSKEGFTYSQYLELREYITSEKDQILKVLQACTKKDLMEYHSGYRDVTKDRLVKSVYESLLSFMTLDGCVSVDYFAGETYESALLKTYATITETKFLAWQSERIAEANKLRKALSNPETLSEFSTFLSYRSLAALSPDQLALYDSLKADRSRAEKVKELERKAQLSAVNLDGLEFSLHESMHTKKNIPLWVVQLNGRVERDVYTDLNSKAKALNGYYSSYRGQGAIPGFTFTEESNAKAFMGLQSGDVDASAVQLANLENKVLNRAETLTEKGDRLASSSLESLNRDRKDNTERRARMASNAESRALSELEFAQTMQVIAEGLKAGTIKYLDRLQTYTELDELYTILDRAKYRYLKVKEMKTADFEWTTAVCDFAHVPYPSVYIENLYRVLDKLASEKGKLLAARRMHKRAEGFKKQYPDILSMVFRGDSGIKDFKTLFCSPSSKVDKYELESYRNSMARYERVVRLGLNEPHELRAALRELVTVRNSVTVSPEVKRSRELKELDRKFVNAQIDGFFPTPEKLANAIVLKAELEAEQKVGEFSAGLGHLASAILDECPEADLHLCEINHRLAEALRFKGFENVVNDDFLSLTPTGDFDRVIINPPFENGQDIDHVLHAWEFLKPGGLLVAIMAGNKKHESRNSKVSGFVEFVSAYGTLEENEPGAFLSAFRPTGVSTVTVVLHKPNKG